MKAENPIEMVKTHIDFFKRKLRKERLIKSFLNKMETKIVRRAETNSPTSIIFQKWISGLGVSPTLTCVVRLSCSLINLEVLSEQSRFKEKG